MSKNEIKNGPQGIIREGGKRTEVCNAPSEVAGPHGEALIEQIMQGLSELDEIGRREVLKYAIKIRNSSRSQNGNSHRRN